MLRTLERTGCQVLAERRLSALSGGQLKRVLLAFGVVRPRELLVLDEAQAGLDAPSTERFQELLLELRRQEGWTVLQVSHDLGMVRRSCDQVLCLNQRLRCSGALNIIDNIIIRLLLHLWDQLIAALKLKIPNISKRVLAIKGGISLTIIHKV